MTVVLCQTPLAKSLLIHSSAIRTPCVRLCAYSVWMITIPRVHAEIAPHNVDNFVQFLVFIDVQLGYGGAMSFPLLWRRIFLRRGEASSRACWCHCGQVIGMPASWLGDCTFNDSARRTLVHSQILKLAVGSDIKGSLMIQASRNL